MMDPAGLQVPAITQNTRTFPIADRLQQDPVDFVPWLKRVRRHAAKQNSLFRDGNLYMNKDNRPAGTPPDYTDNPQAFSEFECPISVGPQGLEKGQLLPLSSL